MKKKIGILSLYYNNFNMGGMLQAYALQKYLDEYEAEQICFDFMFHYGKGNIKIRKIKKKIRRLFHEDIDIKLQGRIRKYREFSEEIKNSKKVFFEAKEFSKRYDKVIVGSDQVWALSWMPEGAQKVFLLDDEEFDGKRYSYAASIGMDFLTDKEKYIFTRCLSRFNNISVREKTASGLLNNIHTGKNIDWNIDPTLLLSKEEWETIMVNPDVKEGYIFCYFLGKNFEYREAVYKLSRRLNKKIVNIPYAKDNKMESFDEGFADIDDVSGGPKEFLGWIHEADLVITDSFHATIFCCQFETPFYTLARKNDETVTMNSRMTDLLKMLKLEDRYITVDNLGMINDIYNMNFEESNTIIREKREKSREYINKEIFSR